MRLWVIALLSIAGCIRPAVLECGDLVCPTSSTCVGETGALHCASSDQLAACVGLNPSDPCVIGGENGSCVDGACQPSVCGNGILEPGEACDGTNVPLTCSDFAYYTGEVTCTPLCTYDRSGCSGKCGDGIVQPLEGELCDGAPPSTTCVDFGRNYGALGCSKFCTPDIGNDCGDLGWQTLYLGTGLITGAASNKIGALEIDGGMLKVQYDGVTDAHDLGDVTALAATTDSLFALGPTTTLRYNATGWTTLPAMGTFVAIASDGTSIYAIDGSCAVTRLDVTGNGATSTIASPAMTGCLGLDVLGAAMVVFAADRIAWTSGSSAWTTKTGLTPSAVSWRNATQVFVVNKAGATPGGGSGGDSGTEVDRFDTASGALTHVSDAFAVVAAVNGNEIDATQIGTGTEGGERTYPIAGLVDVVPVSLTQPDQYSAKPYLVRTGDGGVMEWTNVEVFRLGPTLAPLHYPVAPAGFLPSPDGSVVTCTSTTLQQTMLDGTSVSHPWTNGACTSEAGAVSGVHYVATASEIYRYDTTSHAYVADLAGSYLTLFAQGSTAWSYDADTFTISRRETSSWVAHPAPSGCTADSFVTTAAGAFGMFRCAANSDTPSHLYQWQDPAGWTIVSDPIVSYYVWAAADGTLLGADPSGVEALSGTTWSVASADVGNDFVARTSSDIYFTDPMGGLHHWDGAIMAPITLSTYVDDGALITLPDALVIDGSSVLAWWEPRPSGL